MTDVHEAIVNEGEGVTFKVYYDNYYDEWGKPATPFELTRIRFKDRVFFATNDIRVTISPADNNLFEYTATIPSKYFEFGYPYDVVGISGRQFEDALAELAERCREAIHKYGRV